MGAIAKARWRAAILVIAPVVLLFGLAYHPFIADLTDNTAVVEHLAHDPGRWFVAHFATSLGSGLLILAFVAVRGQLREMGDGEERWSALALPFIVLGSTLFAMLPGMEIGVLAAHAAGADTLAVQNSLDTWFMPTVMSSTVLFAIGALGFAKGIAGSGILSRELSWLVAGGLVVAAATRIPFGAALILSGAATVVALWPLAYVAWTRPTAERAAEARAASAT